MDCIGVFDSSSLPLPFLIFDSGLLLINVNKVGREVFSCDEEIIGKHASWFLTGEQATGKDEIKVEENNLRKRLNQLTISSRKENGSSWGAVDIISYFTGIGLERKGQSCEAIINYFPEKYVNSSSTLPEFEAHGFSILFTKPLPSKIITTIEDTSTSAGHASIETPVVAEIQKDAVLPLLDPYVASPNEIKVSNDSKLFPHLENASHYEALVNNLPSIIFTSDSEGKINYFNKQWYKFTGLSFEQSTDLSILESVFDPEELKNLIEVWVKSVTTGCNFDTQYRIRRKDGQLEWFLATGRPFNDGTGVVWMVSLTPISDIISAQLEAKKAQKLIKEVLHGAKVNLLSVDTSSIITFYEGNTLFSDSPTTNPSSSPVGQPLKIIWPDSKVNEAVKRMLDEQLDELTWTTSAEDAINNQYFQYRLVPLKAITEASPEDEVLGVIVVAGDVTQIVAAKLQLAESESQRVLLLASETAANEASRLKTEFVTNISHEIRTPIAAIIGFCDILLDDKTLSNDQASLVEKSLRSGEILLDLVGAVLDMGKVEAGKLIIEKEPFYLAEAIHDASLLSVPIEKKGIRFIKDITPHYTGVVIGDKMRIQQVLCNALSNSVKFTKEGSITLSVRQESESSTQCVFIFTIKDTGIGIDEAVLPTLFSPFRQADASTARHYGGSGLGLVIAKRLVELMNGTINLTSTKNVGSCMEIRIPLEKVSTSRAITSSNISNPIIQSSSNSSIVKSPCKSAECIHILIAEDNDLIREIVIRILTKLKFQVTGVIDGASAVKAVEENDFDLILMDGQMGSMDGYEATAQIRALPDPIKRNIKIIALTASAFKGDKERCLQAGMDDYLSKPVRGKELEEMIWNHLRPIIDEV